MPNQPEKRNATHLMKEHSTDTQFGVVVLRCEMSVPEAIWPEFSGCTNLGLMRSSREVTFYLCVMLLRSVTEQHIHSGWPLM